MKSNQKFKLDNKAEANTAMVGGIVALLLMIIVGVMIYFEFSESIDPFDEQAETFTGYSHGDNATAKTVTVENSPDGTGNTNVTCYSFSAGTLSYPTFTLNNRIVSMAAGAASNFTQINVTYTSKMASDEADATDMASTVFSLLPLVALVIVASIILAVVVGFGSGKQGGL